MKTIYIQPPFITLGQFLKFADVIQNGGEAKFFLQENQVTVGGVHEERRGRKCYPGDEIVVNGKQAFVVALKS